MNQQRPLYIGTDCGATTSKVGGVWENGTTISTQLLQRPTRSEGGPEEAVRGWVESVEEFLRRHSLNWDQVQGVGLAIPGPFIRYGVIGLAANLPPSFEGFDLHTHFGGALAERAGRSLPLTIGNDGDLGGVAEAHKVRGLGEGSVLMLAPGSGLGGALIGSDGLPIEGGTLTAMEVGHMPLPLHLLDVKPYPCGCGRDWGCAEVYTALSGLPYLLEEKLAEHPDHPLARSNDSMRDRAFSLRDLAREGDEVAQEMFDFQAKALGYHLANLIMAVDPRYVVIGGGLMDPESTTKSFRQRYLRIVRETAEPYMWPAQRSTITVVAAALGDLSQAIGAALAALFTART